MVSFVGSTSGTSTPALPAHAVGDRIIGVIAGKPDTTGAWTLSGFTLVKTLTGGTGSQGADTGQTYIQVFAMDAPDTSTTAPTTGGGSGSNTVTVAFYAYRPTAGRTWRDAIGADVDWVQGGSDTDSGVTDLLATASAFTNQPTDGDAILTVGSVPSDTGSALGSATASATGLAGGTHTTRVYRENANNNDCAQTGADWTGFTGTASSGVTVSHTITGLSATGTVAAIALREATVDLSGAATVSQPTQVGDLSSFQASDLSGAATVSQPTQAGELDVEQPGIIGAATIDQPVQVGILEVETTLSGAATVTQPTQAGVLSATALASWDPNTMLGTDGVHPNDVGMTFLADCFQASLADVGITTLPSDPLVAYGDSWTAQDIENSVGLRAIVQLANRLGATLTNRSVSGSQSWDVAKQAVRGASYTAGSTGVAFLSVGLNDLLETDTAKHRRGVESHLRATMAVMSAAQRIENTSLTYSAGWTQNSFTGSSGGSNRSTSTNGATATFNITTAGDYYLLSHGANGIATVGGKLTISQASVDLASIDLNENTSPDNVGSVAVRIPDVATGTLTITFSTEGRSGAIGWIDALLRLPDTPVNTILAVKPVEVLESVRAANVALLAHIRDTYDLLAAEFGAHVVVCDPEVGLSTSPELSGAAQVSQPTQAGVLDVALAAATLSGAASVSQPVQAGVLQIAVGTDTSNRDDGIDLDGTAEVVFEPDVAAVPTGLSLGEHRTVAHVITTPPTWGGEVDFAEGVQSAQAVTGLLDRVVIRDTDFTFYRGHPVVIDFYRLIDPLLYGSARVTIPGINPQFETTLDLVEFFKDARVLIQRRTAAGVVESTDFKGFVSKVDTNGTELSLDIGGQAAGRLSGLYVPPPVYRRRQDVEHILVDTLRDARVRTHEHDGSSGVSLIRRGGSDGLSIFNETLAIWAGATGDPITFTPNANGAYRKTVKDTTTIHATAYIDSALISQALSQDFAEQYNRVYAHGRTAASELITNIRTPGLTQGEVPDFPRADLVPLEVGMTDADTDTGAGVTSVQEQLALHNFYDVNDGTPGEYDAAVASAVMVFQVFAGLNVTGEVGPNTWDALWNLPKIGYSLDDAREYPQAQDTATQKWFRTANGSKIEENPAYDPHVVLADTFIDVGGPFGKGQIHAFAESKLAPAGGVWFGTLDFSSGLVARDHTPSDPFTSADVMPARDLQPNMNIKLPYFAGGITVTVTGIDVSDNGSKVQALVSTHPATTMETWEAIERRRESKSNPGRTWSGHVRSSQVRNDEAVQWDTSSGWLANKVALTADEWTEVKVPAGQAGIVQRIRMQIDPVQAFGVLLTQKPVSLDRLNGIQPLEEVTSGRPWYEQESVVDWLEDRGKLDAWGTFSQPCGFDPSVKTDENGPTGQPVTGLFVEDAGFNYETGSEPVLYLYVWSPIATFLQPGRILRNQRTTDI